ncbi:hypothetical protein LEMLEM_LOCUS2731, partial [Lemmus lemmus]
MSATPKHFLISRPELAPPPALGFHVKYVSLALLSLSTVHIWKADQEGHVPHN